MKKLLEFATDFVLASVLVGIFAVSFFYTTQLTPTNLQEVKQPVLGANAQKLPDFTFNSNLKVTKLNEKTYQYNLVSGKLEQEDKVIYLANVKNNTDSTKLLTFAAQIPARNLTGVRYTLQVNNRNYLIYDDQADKQLRTFQIDIGAGAEAELAIKIHSYTKIAYNLEIGARLSY